jgi:platelet-activating factor acetylhydrolase IB subunit alpha
MQRSQLLSERQQLELNKAILQYLQPILHDEHSQVYDSLKLLLEIDGDDQVIPNYLEKKWSTVLRLQKKIIDLENELSNFRTIFDGQTNNRANGLSLSKDKINWLPYNVNKSFLTQSSQIINTVVIHPYLPSIMAGCSDGSIISWNLVNDETAIPDKIIKAHTRAVNKISWSWQPLQISNSKQYVFASCSADLSIKIYSDGTYNNIRTLTGHEHTISSIKFSQIKPEILYSVSRDKNIKVWDVLNGFCIKSFVGHSDWVRDIDVININSKLSLQTIKNSNIGDFLITCSNDHSIRLSHADSGTGLALLIGHTHVVETIKFLPLISNIHLDKFLKENHPQFPTIPSDIIVNKDYSEILGYKYCVSAGRDNSVKIWLLPPPVIVPHRHPLPAKVNNSQGWLIADLKEHSSWVKAISIHPSGRFIFTGSDDRMIKIWDLSSLNTGGRVRCIRTLSGNEGFINDLDFARFNLELEMSSTSKSSEDEHKQILLKIESKMRCLFVSGGADNCVKLWS